MNKFKDFIREDEDVQKTIKKLPKSIQNLVKGYEFRFFIGNTLPGDDGHVGMIVNKPKKVISISAPYYYCRELVVLHEIGHLVYEILIRNKPIEKEWKNLVKKHKKDMPKNTALNQDDEEIFCMVFGSAYTNHKIETFNNDNWVEFVRGIK